MNVTDPKLEKGRLLQILSAEARKDKILQDLQKQARMYVEHAKDPTKLRAYCREFFTKSANSSEQHVRRNPQIIHEILERTLLLYELCLVELGKWQQSQELLAELSGEKKDEGSQQG